MSGCVVLERRAIGAVPEGPRVFGALPQRIAGSLPRSCCCCCDLDPQCSESGTMQALKLSESITVSHLPPAAAAAVAAAACTPTPQRFFSSTMQNFSFSALLMATGLGAKKVGRVEPYGRAPGPGRGARAQGSGARV